MAEMRWDILKFNGKMDYVVRYPKDYQEGEKRPVLIYLHGAGGRTDTIPELQGNRFFAETVRHADFPFVSIAPLCHERSWYDVMETLKDLVKHIAASDYADPERLYLMGSSMGGYGCWQLAMSMNEWFAAIVPICGGGMYWSAYELVNVPVWAFHGALDDTVFPEESQKMVDAINGRGGNAKLTIYPENGHDSWVDTYRNIEVFRWLLSHKNENAHEIVDLYTDSSRY